jgi:NAD(P)-dependent dehydrogenase (short-subunit alcohol dehydrogenase family)
VNGRLVVVTGGHGALGEAVVAAFAARGATVQVPPKDVRLDNEAHVVAYYAALPSLWASIHVAGGFAFARIADTSVETIEQQWRTNVLTCFLSCREAIKAMRRSGGGRIVNIASRAALVPSPGMAAYVAAKGGVTALTQTLAAEVLADGILVNCVLPSIIDTPANRSAMPDADHAAWPKPAEIAETIAFLASPRNTLTSGALVPVYGRG